MQTVITDLLCTSLCAIAILFLLLVTVPPAPSERVWTPRDLDLCHSICSVYRKEPPAELLKKDLED